MVWTVGVLAVLSAFAGFIQVVPLWEPINDWLEPVSENLLHANGWQELIASTVAVLVGAAGVWVAWEAYAGRNIRVPRPLPLLEHKFYWDELYDQLFYRPAELGARAFARFVEQPVIAGSIDELTRGFRAGSGELSRVQNGLVRSYVLALAAGLVVLAVVFLIVK
jgi:NADH:ubiquinone oxidoreductase subunit 5 (subunit L)/multisubunit Na+/H+ antiporter MnhA subunit